MIKQQLSYSNKFIVSIVLIVLIIMAIIYIYLYRTNQQLSHSININDQQETPLLNEQQVSQFPLSKNDMDTYSFSCKVTKLIKNPKFLTKDKKYIIIGVACVYLDKNQQEQNIKVPLVITNNNQEQLIENKFIKTELKAWTSTSYLNYISELYYLTHLDKDNYDSIENSNYWHGNVNKPTIDINDDIKVVFALTNSQLFENKAMKDIVSFSQTYHQNIYNYQNINNFIGTGNPQWLNTEPDHWIIPSWAIFNKDNQL